MAMGNARKRGRDMDIEADERNADKVALSRLMRLCDQELLSGDINAMVASIEDAVKLCRRDIQYNSRTADSVMSTILDCATELSTKTPIFAVLIGLLNAENSELGRNLVDQLCASLGAALAGSSPGEHDTARLQIRLLACLGGLGVVQPLAVLGLMHEMVAAAGTRAQTGGDPTGHTWQPWADWLVYCCMAALPWAGPELAAACPAQLAGLVELIEEYLAVRPIKLDTALRPFLSPIKEADLAAESDSGAASFLPQLWAALTASAAVEDPWRCQSVPHLLSDTALAARLSTGLAHELAGVVVPSEPPIPPELAVLPSAAAAYVRQCFPVRGGIKMLAAQHTEGARPLVERFVAEEYMLDTLVAYDADRVACVKTLTSLPLDFTYNALLAELLFSQLLALPTTRLPQLCYCTVMVDLCKFPHFEFPKALSACVRECFVRLGVADPELPPRLVGWLSYHLSNFEFQWPWDRWEKYIDEPEDNPHRQFCQQLVARLQRLSYWERVHQALPPKFAELLGPAPHPPSLPGHEDPAQQTDMEANGQQGLGEPAVERVLAGQVLTEIRSKSNWEALLVWMEQHAVDEAVGQGPLGPLKVMMLAVLAAGSKSPTHLSVALERYAPALRALIAACPDAEGAARALVSLAAEFYAPLPQKVLMVVDRLLALRLVGAAGVVQWACVSAIPTTLSSPVAASSGWELLHHALGRQLAARAEGLEKASLVASQAGGARRRADVAGSRAERARQQLVEWLRQAGRTGDEADLMGASDAELEAAVGQDLTARSLLAGLRDAQFPVQKLIERAEELEAEAEGLRLAAEEAGSETPHVLATAMSGLVTLLKAEEEGDEAMATDGNGPSRVRAHCVATQCRAFARRYAPCLTSPDAVVVVREALAEAPSSLLAALQEVLHADVSQ